MEPERPIRGGAEAVRGEGSASLKHSGGRRRCAWRSPRAQSNGRGGRRRGADESPS
jgi:hypothetical protein